MAFQSLYFEFGSQQLLHRDPVHVQTKPASHLLAAWIALEDIGPDCGPLCYVPGSHKVPYYEFSPQEAARPPGSDYTPAYEFTAAQCAKRGLKEQVLTCKQGDFLLWHASLVHGARPPRRPELTRKSLVIHYSTRRHYRERNSVFLKKTRPSLVGAPVARSYLRTTRKVTEVDQCCGFESPVEGFVVPHPLHGLGMKIKFHPLYGLLIRIKRRLWR